MRGQSTTIATVSVGATTPVTVLAAKVNRAAAVIFNVTGTLYLKYGQEPGIPPWTHRLVANDSIVIDNFTGAVSAVKASGTSDVYVTDIW